MYILLGLTTEIASCIISYKIITGTMYDCLLEVAKKGYKIDAKELNKDVAEEKNATKEDKFKDLRESLNLLLFLIPGINIIHAHIRSFITKNNILKDKYTKKIMIPMTDDEKDGYSRMKTKQQKLMYMAYIIENEEEEERLIGFIGDNAIIYQKGVTMVYNDKLTPLAYTLDEVEELNDITNGEYKLGTIDGVNTAIIGVNSGIQLQNKLKFRKDNFKKSYEFIPINEEDAKNEKFVIYPLSGDIKKLDEKVDEIIKDRSKPSSRKRYTEDDITDEFLMRYMNSQVREEEKGNIYCKRRI